MGLAEINESKAVAMLDDSEGRASAYEKGIGFMSSVWMGNKTNPTVAATLAAFSITTGRLDAVRLPSLISRQFELMVFGM